MRLCIDSEDPRIQSALEELKGMIAQRYPEAIFEVSVGSDPAGVYLDVIVDVEDTIEVTDVIIDRLVDIQVEERLPIYVIAMRPLHRVLE